MLRVDIDAVFASRLAAVEAARQAAREVAELRAAEKAVPQELLRTASHAGRSSKGGHVGLNRFKARVRHFFNWAIAQGYRDDTPFKRHGVNVVRLNGAAETVRARRLQPGEEDRLVAAATPYLRALIIAALSTGCRVGELLTLQWQSANNRSSAYRSKEDVDGATGGRARLWASHSCKGLSRPPMWGAALVTPSNSKRLIS